MDFSLVSGIFDLFKNVFLQMMHWNKMNAALIKVCKKNDSILLTYIVSNIGTHELMISDLEIELGNYPTPGSPIISNQILPIKVKPNEMQEVSVELPSHIFDEKSEDSFFVIVMTVYTMKGQQYYMYKKNPLDIFKLEHTPFKLDKQGKWLKERYGIS